MKKQVFLYWFIKIGGTLLISWSICFLLHFPAAYLLERRLMTPTAWVVDRQTMMASHPACPTCQVPLPQHVDIGYGDPMGNRSYLSARSRLSAAELIDFYETAAAAAPWTLTLVEHDDTGLPTYIINFPSHEVSLRITALPETTWWYATSFTVTMDTPTS